jgi:capsular polysaccharide transport system permease protein
LPVIAGCGLNDVMSDSSSLSRTPPLPGAAPVLKTPRFTALRTIVALMLREMSSTYGRKPGGYLWALLEPIGAITVLSIGFSLFMHNPPLGNSFVLFFATGFLPFSLYITLSQKVQQSLKYSKPLLAYPRVTWIDAVLARFILAVLTQLLIMMLVFAGIMAVSDTSAIVDLVPILIGLSIVTLLGFGIGIINAVVGGIFPVWLSLWSIINRPLFFVSGIFFTYESMPEVVQNIIWWNPIMQAVAIVREGFYPTYEADFVSLAYCFGLALTLIAFGLLITRKWYKLVFER